MAGKVIELTGRDDLAVQISNLYDNFNSQRQTWLDEKKELRDYIFATDTTKTTNSKLPWKNKTTIPKLTQIRDNLHANYLSALFPNDDWQRWESYSKEDSNKDKRDSIEAYMKNKTREGDLYTTVSQLLFDYIDYGNCFATVDYINESVEDEETGETIPGYIGPKVLRISPLDILFNPIVNNFNDSPVIRRVIKNIGELYLDAEESPEKGYDLETVKKIISIRKESKGLSQSDWNKATGYSVDGFGSLQEYYQSNYVEILEFEGTLYDSDSGELHKDRVITVVDRTHVLRNIPNPRWIGKTSVEHAGWRFRPDNLWAMGPLDNLVGMQYRLDHLENLKADVFDLIAHPPLKIRGNVESFEWGPNSEIILGDDGDVEMMAVDGTSLQADMQIQLLENKMEEMAGAPRQAMGIRTPGEKTAFEVQSLQNAASRIFQEKITNFELFLEKILNRMLEVSKRNLDGTDIIRVFDEDQHVINFLNITKEDITATGKIRPIGARHFGAKALKAQNTLQMTNSLASDPEVREHVSSYQLAKLWEDLLELERYSLVEKNTRVYERAEKEQLMRSIQNQMIQQDEVLLAQEQGDIEGGPQINQAPPF